MSKKEILMSATSLALLAAFALPALADTATTSPNPSTPPLSKIACVGAAVATREQALDAAYSAFTQATNAAYTARQAALQAAYALTDVKSVRAAVKAAWGAFQASMQTARNGWKTARGNAWSAFRTAAHACKAPGSISDSGQASSEAGGQ